MHDSGVASRHLIRVAETVKHLRMAGFNQAPGQIETRSGNMFVDLEGKTFSLHRYLEGEGFIDWMYPGLSEKHINAAGGSLGSLHRAGRTVLDSLDEAVRKELELDFGKLGKDYENTLLDFSDITGKMVLVPQLTGSFYAELERIKEFESQNLKTIVHGDYHPGNVIFKEGTVKAVIDFDYLQVGHPLRDISYALVTFARKNAAHKLDYKCCSSFLKGYLTGQPDLSPHWLEGSTASILSRAKPFLVMSCHLHIFWLMDRQLKEKNQKTAYPKQIRCFVRLAEDLERNCKQEQKS